MRNHGKRLVRRPCTFLKKLQKDREITDFTVFSGGDEGDRTLDLTDANRTLSQLSYAPKLWKIYNFQNSRYARRRTQWACSADSLLSQLSYGPTYEIIPRPGQRYILYHKIRHGQGQFSILCKLRKKHRRIVRRCFQAVEKVHWTFSTAFTMPRFSARAAGRKAAAARRKRLLTQAFCRHSIQYEGAPAPSYSPCKKGLFSFRQGFSTS